MGFFAPVQPPYDPLEWAKRPFAEKSRMVCRAWALQGYGSPLAVYLFYVAKLAAYGLGWAFFCGFPLREIASWWLLPIAFQKAILWSMLFEILGLGCGSGPLTGRYVPPLGGFLHFLRPGTTRLPLWRGLGTRRTWLDVLLYAAAIAAMLRALLAPSMTPALVWPIVALVAALGVLDKTLFLAARGEHYWTTAAVFALAADFVPGAKAVQAALWFWAGVSKLNRHFPAVVCVMTSNSPFTRFEWLRKRMYRAFPDDLTPSRWAVIAHGGTALEFAIPALLLAGDGGPLTLAGLVLMLALHVYITSNVPMGVPIEWNAMMVYGAFFLFWKNAAASVLALQPATAAFLAVMLIAVPLVGNLFPERVSFLLAMRYYAGNWANSIWLFRGDSHRKLERVKKCAPWPRDQLLRFYDERTTTGILGRVIAFRLMHLHGRALPALLQKAVERPDEYEWVDGELVAGLVLGWNFGEGHLHHEQLLRAVQEQCGFEPGELRCIFVESQPLLRPRLSWRIADAATGPIAHGEVAVSELRALPPWGVR